jgi:hypothetical protein
MTIVKTTMKGLRRSIFAARRLAEDAELIAGKWTTQRNVPQSWHLEARRRRNAPSQVGTEDRLQA